MTAHVKPDQLRLFLGPKKYPDPDSEDSCPYLASYISSTAASIDGDGITYFKFSNKYAKHYVAFVLVFLLFLFLVRFCYVFFFCVVFLFFILGEMQIWDSKETNSQHHGPCFFFVFMLYLIVAHMFCFLFIV